MRTIIKEYIKIYNICQKIKIPNYKSYKTLNLLLTPSRPWEEIIIDFIINLLFNRWKDGVYNSILIIINYYT